MKCGAQAHIIADELNTIQFCKREAGINEGRVVRNVNIVHLLQVRKAVKTDKSWIAVHDEASTNNLHTGERAGKLIWQHVWYRGDAQVSKDHSAVGRVVVLKMDSIAYSKRLTCVATCITQRLAKTVILKEGARTCWRRTLTVEIVMNTELRSQGRRVNKLA